MDTEHPSEQCYLNWRQMFWNTKMGNIIKHCIKMHHHISLHSKIIPKIAMFYLVNVNGMMILSVDKCFISYGSILFCALKTKYGYRKWLFKICNVYCIIIVKFVTKWYSLKYFCQI
eukprot:515956_1